MTIRAARLGPPSPLPPLRPLRYIADAVTADDSVPWQARQHLNYGCQAPVLPYEELNDYDRQRRDRHLRVAILENENLRATFLLDLGGRLWSLFHKPSGRELLYVNRVFQPTNQAVRNAWFSGGVEWNVSLRGHCPFTCTPLFAQELRLGDGQPLLRMFEFERARRMPFAIDLWLPVMSEFLLVKVHLWNPHEETIPMYWWSNMAIPEHEGTRVFVPTDHTFCYSYQGSLSRVAFPHINDVDASYPTNLAQAADYFFDIPEGSRPWIAAIDRKGNGLVQTSTLRARGRKMFVWGSAMGGRRWQMFLTDGDGTYFEIQAGLTQTQYECLPMPAGAYWSWVEAYGPLSIDPEVAHGDDWQVARRHVEDDLQQRLPAAVLKTCLHSTTPAFNSHPVQWLNHGSGWGFIESRLRRLQETAPETSTTPERVECPGFALFPADSVGPRERRWLDLLSNGNFTARNSREPPDSWQVGADWRRMLQNALAHPTNAHWYAWWCLGVMAYYDDNRETAAGAWRRSLTCEPNAWAYRNLAVLATEVNEAHSACDLLAAARALLPAERNIALEYAAALLAAQRPRQLLEWFETLPLPLAREPRLRLSQVQAQIALGQLDAVERFLCSEFELPDLREGDHVLTDLWLELMTQRHPADPNRIDATEFRVWIEREFPPPAGIDFRMRD